MRSSSPGISRYHLSKGNSRCHLKPGSRTGRLGRRLFALDGIERHDKTVSAISLRSRALVLLLEAWGVPTRSKSRTLALTECLASSSEDSIAEFLRAYVEGDGHLAEEGLEIAT